MKKISAAFVILLSSLVSILIIRTLLMSPPPSISNPTKALALTFPQPQIYTHLSQAIQFKTLSASNQNQIQDFKAFLSYLKHTYPLVFKTLQTQTFDQSLLLKWPGQNPQLKPALFLAHLDVVPIANLKNWSHPPFKGEVDKTHIWGRGTLDDKGSLMAILEGIQALIKQKETPQHTLYFAFGQDEEIGGLNGASKIADYFESKKIQFEFALDEGLAIVPGAMIGLKKPVALIGISEKGYQSIELIAKGKGGHSSMPPSDTAVHILSKTITKLQSNPMPARLTAATQEMFATLGPHMGFGKKIALANLWALEPLLLNQLSKKPATNALIRTTMAPTILQGSPQENVLASSAKAIINLRVLPGDTLKGIKTHLNKVISDPRVTIKFLANRFPEAPKESSTKSPGFQSIHNSIASVYPEAHIAPSLVLATTDSRSYEHLCKDMYRFLPVYFSEEDLKRVHGSNERISKASYLKSIQFYAHIISNL